MKRRVKRHAVIQPLEESYRLIPLTRKQNALVDKEDFDYFSQWNWCALWSIHTRSFYAVRRELSTGKIQPMHYFILELKNGEQGDHRNHNTLDNRKENLRKVTHRQNMFNRRRAMNNTSGFIGVTWCKVRKKWVAQAKVLGKHKFFGYFESAEDAARVRDDAVKKIHGEFASLNFQE